MLIRRIAARFQRTGRRVVGPSSLSGPLDSESPLFVTGHMTYRHESGESAVARTAPVSRQSLPRESWFGRIAWTMWTGWLLLAIVIRLTVADRWVWTQLVYYTTPWTLLACGGVVLLLRRNASRAGRAFAVALTLLAGGAALLKESSWFPDSLSAAATDRPVVRMVLWNVGLSRAAIPDQVRELQRLNPDLAVLIEANDISRRSHDEWASGFPGYTVLSPGQLMVFLVRGDVVVHPPQPLGIKARVQRLTVTVHGDSFDVLAVDIVSSPVLERQTALEHIAQLARANRGRPLVIAGDFNTPDDSLWFRELKAECRSALRTVGQQRVATWPVPIPLLGLDQIWTNREVQLLSARTESTWSSDHQLVVAELQRRVDPSAQENVQRAEPSNTVAPID